MPIVLPALIYLIGGFLIPLFKRTACKVFMVSVALVGLINVILIEPQTSWVYPFLGLKLIFLQADKLSLIIGYIFALIALLGVIYSLKAEEKGIHVSGFLYVGSSIGAVFAGDFFTLYIFWEIMAISSTIVVWSRQDKKAIEIGFRYLIMHLTGGVILLTGILVHYASTGSIEVTAITTGLPTVLFFIGVGLNAGFIPLHTWLPDAYPTAPIAGSVFMSVFTTKTAVYLLARTLSGVEAVAYMGAIMAVYGVSFALMQNNARKLLSYHIISQVGYMVAAIGIGSAMGINGAIFHLLNNLLYKTVLFMGIGAVLYRTGKEELTELGGLTKKMPITTIAVSIAALSISGMALFNGFVSKGMIFDAAHGNDIIYLMLELAAVGTFLSFLKLTYFGFFRRNDKIEAKEAPFSMTTPMVVLAFLCILIGVYPGVMADILPYPIPADFHIYSLGHVVGVLGLLGMTAVIFFIGRRFYAPHKRTTLDFDYFYLKGVITFVYALKSATILSNGIDKIYDKLYYDVLTNQFFGVTNNAEDKEKMLNQGLAHLSVITDKEELIPVSPKVLSITRMMASVNQYMRKVIFTLMVDIWLPKVSAEQKKMDTLIPFEKSANSLASVCNLLSRFHNGNVSRYIAWIIATVTLFISLMVGVGYLYM